MKKTILITCVLLVAAVKTNTQQKDFQRLSSPYLGLKPSEVMSETGFLNKLFIGFISSLK